MLLNRIAKIGDTGFKFSILKVQQLYIVSHIDNNISKLLLNNNQVEIMQINLNVSLRNVTAFSLTGVFAMMIIIITCAMVAKLHGEEYRKKKISGFFRFFTTICAVGICLSSLAICFGEGLWLFASYKAHFVIAYTIIQHGITFLLVGIIFVGRLYFTFSGTKYSFSNKLYAFLIGYFSSIIVIGIILTVTHNVIKFMSNHVFSIIIIIFTCIFIISATSVVLLFIQTMRKVEYLTLAAFGMHIFFSVF